MFLARRGRLAQDAKERPRGCRRETRSGCRRYDDNVRCAADAGGGLHIWRDALLAPAKRMAFDGNLAVVAPGESPRRVGGVPRPGVDNCLRFCCILSTVADDRHPNKDIEGALAYARSCGWTVIKSSGRAAHAWGVMRCPGDCPQVSIYSTPRVPENHARALRRAVDRCSHSTDSEKGNDDG